MLKVVDIYRTYKAMWWGKPQLQPVFGHRQSSWIELFFDLMFVAAISVLNQKIFSLVNYLTWQIIGIYFLGFLSVWLIWMSVTFYSNWFEMNSVRHRVIILGNIVAIGLLTFSLTTNFTWRVNMYSLAVMLIFIGTRVMLFFTWHVAQKAYAIPSVQQAVRTIQGMYAISIGCGIAIFVVTTMFKLHLLLVLCLFGAILLFEFFILPLIFAHSQAYVTTLHRGHLTERFGLFTMLLLGEMILTTLGGCSKQPFTFHTGVELCLGLFIIFSYWWVYYDQVLSTSFRETGRSRVIWTTFHFVFAVTTALLAVNFQFLMEQLTFIIQTKNWLIGCFLVFFVSITVLHYTLDHKHLYVSQVFDVQLDTMQQIHKYMKKVIFTRIVSIICLCALLIAPISTTIELLIYLSSIFIVNIIVGITVWLQATHHIAQVEIE